MRRFNDFLNLVRFFLDTCRVGGSPDMHTAEFIRNLASASSDDMRFNRKNVENANYRMLCCCKLDFLEGNEQ